MSGDNNNGDQGDFFKKKPPPKPKRVEKPVAERAGTKIHHDVAIGVFAPHPITHRREFAGWVDPIDRVYQGGGAQALFVYWKDRLISLQREVWEQVTGRYQHLVDWIEMVDKPSNTVFRIAAGDAQRLGRWFSAGIGQRWGVPYEAWMRGGCEEVDDG